MKQHPKVEQPSLSFRWRALATQTLSVGFLLLLVSGVMLYLTPRGRVAHWTDWTLLGLSKDAWTELHTVLAVVVVVAGVFHLYFNWSIFVMQLSSRLTRWPRPSREFGVAVVLVVLCCGATLLGLPPFGQLISLRESVKNHWEAHSARAPVAHAEELTLAELIRQTYLAREDVLTALHREGITVSEDEVETVTVQQLAQRHGVAPSDIYDYVRRELAPRGRAGEEAAQRKGYGRLTLQAFCAQEQLRLEQVQNELQKRGVTATADSTLREVAASLGTTPGALARELLEL